MKDSKQGAALRAALRALRAGLARDATQLELAMLHAACIPADGGEGANATLVAWLGFDAAAQVVDLGCALATARAMIALHAIMEEDE